MRRLGNFSRNRAEETYAVKSALPDTALEVSLDILLLQTAPLCPIKVPTQSPVQRRGGSREASWERNWSCRREPFQLWLRGRPGLNLVVRYRWGGVQGEG